MIYVDYGDLSIKGDFTTVFSDLIEMEVWVRNYVKMIAKVNRLKKDDRPIIHKGGPK